MVLGAGLAESMHAYRHASEGALAVFCWRSVTRWTVTSHKVLIHSDGRPTKTKKHGIAIPEHSYSHVHTTI